MNLQHTPSEIIRQLLVNQSLGTSAVVPSSDNTSWPVYATNEPDVPDNVITIYDTQGRISGRSGVDGERDEHYGIQVRVRSLSHTTGYQKIRAIAQQMDGVIYHNVVRLSSIDYIVHCITRVGDTLPLGQMDKVYRTQDTASKRLLFVFNALVAISRRT